MHLCMSSNERERERENMCEDMFLLILPNYVVVLQYLPSRQRFSVGYFLMLDYMSPNALPSLKTAYLYTYIKV
jgi:hypothetical protein